MEIAHRISPSAHSQGKNRHVEGIAEFADIHELLFREPEIIPISGEVFLHHVKRKSIVAGGYRRVRRKQTCHANLLRRFFERLALLHKFTSTLEQHECRVPFICVENRRLDSESSQNTNAADSENDFLTYPMFLVTTIQPGCQFAVAVLVLFDIRVHQVKRHGAQIHAPNNDENIETPDVQFNEKPFFMARTRRFNWRFGAVEQLVNVFLPAVRLDSLMEIPLRVHKTDTDKRDAQVARFLAMIARQNAKTAGVNRQ